MRIRDKDEDISHMLTKVTRRRAVEYQVTRTRGGWCRLRDFIPKAITMFAKKHGIHAANSYCTPQKIIDLVVNADKPRLGLLREHPTGAISWIRAWAKHEGNKIPPEYVERELDHADDVPTTAVFATKWNTYRKYIVTDGTQGAKTPPPRGRW